MQDRQLARMAEVVRKGEKEKLVRATNSFDACFGSVNISFGSGCTRNRNPLIGTDPDSGQLFADPAGTFLWPLKNNVLSSRCGRILLNNIK